QPTRAMARHVQFESGLSLTGANADRRYSAAPSEIGAIALALLDRVEATDGTPAAHDRGLSVTSATLDAVANLLRTDRGESLVVCGVQDVAVQIVVARLNHVLANIGRTVELSPSSFQKQAADEDMESLVEDMQRGDVDALIFYGVNPVYDWADTDGFLRG